MARMATGSAEMEVTMEWRSCYRKRGRGLRLAMTSWELLRWLGMPTMPREAGTGSVEDGRVWRRSSPSVHEESKTKTELELGFLLHPHDFAFCF
ncbi:unnamed protein product [Linum trigynum]|uniref:Uncharacterized protein n=1 Tax=Linum trigynum TaxID=586398 RepID=A0AAV2DTA9_9ROSI